MLCGTSPSKQTEISRTLFYDSTIWTSANTLLDLLLSLKHVVSPLLPLNLLQSQLKLLQINDLQKLWVSPSSLPETSREAFF